jgi:hypothetical protein
MMRQLIAHPGNICATLVPDTPPATRLAGLVAADDFDMLLTMAGS